MKKVLNLLVALVVTTAVGIVGVDARTVGKSIDANACEEIYTNYYILLEANSEGYFNEVKFSNTYHTDMAEYLNNSYQIRNFDSYNVGYGDTVVNTNSKDSSDGISSMSLSEFYRIYKKSAKTNGAFQEGRNNYIVAHNWYKVVNGEENRGGDGIDFTGLATKDLIAASINADISITRKSEISYRYENPFKLQISRQYAGYLTGTPVKNEGEYWYLQPAVYYVQYCSPKERTVAEDTYYHVYYRSNTSDLVTNMPQDITVNTDRDTYISSNTPRRTGYTFLGWSPYASDQSANSNYRGGSLYTRRSDITLYAIWKKDEVVTPAETYYHVSYRPNTTDYVVNMPNPSDVTVNTKNDIYIASETPVREGYDFMGWSPDAYVATGDNNYRGGTLYQARKDLVLYAIWKKKETPTNPVIPDNPKTGITDYLVPFGGVVSISGLGLGILKKKKTFKQF